MGYYAILKTAYRSLVPETLRRMTWDRNYPVHRIVEPIKHLLQRYASHNEVYDRSYYEEIIEPVSRQSIPVVARSIQDVFNPRTVVDVGCGSGTLLRALRDLGISGIGLEHSKIAMDMARARGLEVRDCDLERPLEELPAHRCDLVISTEVAEHLPERFADAFVGYLCRTSDTALITAAPPGQGGTDHVNEQPNEYWIAKFENRGLTYVKDLSERLRREWAAAGVVSFYASNVLIFSKCPPPQAAESR